ncbi:MAG: glycosyltransferase [Pseudomonadota bacterium]
MSVIYHPSFSNSETRPVQPAIPKTLSVVICSRGHAQDLRKCLAALHVQTQKVDEIIVIDFMSQSMEIEEICRNANVKYARDRVAGIDQARNMGAAAARSDVVAYLDEGGLPRADWAKQILCAFDRPGIAAVAGNVRPIALDTFAEILFNRYWAQANEPFERDYSQSDFLGSGHNTFPAWEVGSGANMAFRRSSFARFGLFDPALALDDGHFSGESEYLYRILGQGGACRYTPDAVIWRRYLDTEAALKPVLRSQIRGHVASLRIQAQRFPGRGNWRRVLITLPACFLRRGVSRLRWGRDHKNWFLLTELHGYFAGLFCSIGRKRTRIN